MMEDVCVDNERGWDAEEPLELEKGVMMAVCRKRCLWRRNAIACG